MESPVAQADRLGRRRIRLFFVVGIILITQQASFDRLLEHGSPLRAVDIALLGAWIVLVTAALVTGGFWLKPRPVRDLMDDDVTKANRASALALGFVLSMATAMALYVVNFVEEVPAGIAIHVIVTCGLAAAMFRFGLLERRALG